MAFKDIEFGYTEAEFEKTYHPELLLKGYLDEFGYTKKILHGNEFLILGSKGSGKSAIGSRLELQSDDTDSKFLYVTQHYLTKDFPYNIFSELLPGREAPETRYPNHWEFLLLIAMLDSFRKDPNLIASGQLDQSSLDILESMGLIDCNFTEIVTKAKKSEWEVDLKILKHKTVSETEKKNLNLNTLFSILKESVYAVDCESKHLIVVDGLDDMLSHRKKQYASIMALITAAARINKKLKDKDVNSKIVIMCRTELFDRLSDSNKNKITQNSSITLNWYQEIHDPRLSNLVKLLNLRAELSLGQKVDVFNDFFPRIIYNNQPTLALLLNHTRHTPRDFIELINKIQNHTAADYVTQTDIANGIHEYSNEYFQREIRDELHGFVENNEDIDLIMSLLSKMQKGIFTYEEILQKKSEDDRFSKIDLLKVLNLLYDCSAIGNCREVRTNYSIHYKGIRKKPKRLYIFKYLNPHSKFEEQDKIVIHKGLRKFLNIRSNA